MELLTEKPVRILAQGLTDSKNEFKNIEFDLPFFEMKQLSQEEDTFQITQKDYNSAEIFNQERRNRFGSVKAYSLKDILKVYQTKAFKMYKMSQVVSVSEYLLKVLKLLEIVNKTLIRIDRDSKAISKSKDFKDKNEKEFVRSKTVVAELFELFSRIILMISDLQTDENNVGLDAIIEDMKEYIRLPLSIHYVPDELVPKISTVFPCLPLSKFSELEKTRGKNILPKAWNEFCQMEEKLFRVIFLFIENMINQFSYYVTPEQFLNNPLGKTIFVIPMSMYKMFNFNNSGLYRKEVIKYGEVSKIEINKKNQDFLSTVEIVFNSIHDEAEKIREELEKESDDFDALKFLAAYEKRYPQEKSEKIKQFLSNPIIDERVTNMLYSARMDLMSVVLHGIETPWFKEMPATVEVKDLDKDTLFFLLQLYTLYPSGLKKFPQAEIWRVFNLFSYSKQIIKCMNWHVKNYEKDSYTISGQYDAKFGSILTV